MIAKATVTNSTEEIHRALQALKQPGDVAELRVLDCSTKGYRSPHNESGYFDDFVAMSTAAAGFGDAGGIYVTLQRIKTALLARRVNRVEPSSKREPQTSDKDVTRYIWLPIDCDVERPSGISSSDEEHARAHELAQSIRGMLVEAGFPVPIYADSGNGAHLLFAIDLPIEDGEPIVKQALETFARLFDSNGVHVDKTLFNPSRIIKLYGTISGKGDDAGSIGRPHRLSRILEIPAPVEVLQRDVLVKFLEQHAEKKPTLPNGKVSTPTTTTASTFSIDDWIQRHSVPVGEPEPYDGTGRRWVFDTCPWNPAHTDRSAFIIQNRDGRLGAGCHHDGCHGKEWHALRALFEPGHKKQAAKGVDTADAPETDPAPYRIVKPSMLLHFNTREDKDELIKTRYLCRRGAVTFTSYAGLGKSTACAQAMTVFAKGDDFFGFTPVSELKSLCIQAENDDGDLAEMLQGVVSGLDLHEYEEDINRNIDIVSQSERTGDAFCRMLRELAGDLKPDLIWIDPLMAFLGGDVSDQKTCSQFLRNGINPVLQEFGCGAFLIHHAPKPPRDPSQKSYKGADLSYLGHGSAELANWPRAAITLREVETGLFELYAAKRGKRAGLVDPDGNPTSAVYLQHGDKGICWKRSAHTPGEEQRDADSERAEQVISEMRQQPMRFSEIEKLIRKTFRCKDTKAYSIWRQHINTKCRKNNATGLWSVNEAG